MAFPDKSKSKIKRPRKAPVTEALPRLDPRRRKKGVVDVIPKHKLHEPAVLALLDRTQQALATLAADRLITVSQIRVTLDAMAADLQRGLTAIEPRYHPLVTPQDAEWWLRSPEYRALISYIFDPLPAALAPAARRARRRGWTMAQTASALAAACLDAVARVMALPSVADPSVAPAPAQGPMVKPRDPSTAICRLCKRVETAKMFEVTTPAGAREWWPLCPRCQKIKGIRALAPFRSVHKETNHGQG